MKINKLLFVVLFPFLLTMNVCAAPDHFDLTPAVQGSFGGWVQNGAHPYTLNAGNCYNLTVTAKDSVGNTDTTFSGAAGSVIITQYTLDQMGGTSIPAVGLAKANEIIQLGKSTVSAGPFVNGVFTFGAGDSPSTQICFYSGPRPPNDYTSTSAVGDFKLKAELASDPAVTGQSVGYIVWHNIPRKMLVIPPGQGYEAASIYGSTGASVSQRIGVPFRVYAKLTDSYWNRILKDARTSDTVRFSASVSALSFNPISIAMVDGQTSSIATIVSSAVCGSTITITADDITSNANNNYVLPDTAEVYVEACPGGIPSGPIQNEGFFQLTVPGVATAGTPFSMTVTAKNVTIADTSGDVSYTGQLLPLVAVSQTQFSLAPGSLGVPTFAFSADDGAADPSDHVSTFNQTYTTAGTIWIQLVAENPSALAGSSAIGGPILVFPGSPTRITASAVPNVIGPLATSLISLAVVDLYGNAVPNYGLRAQMIEGIYGILSDNNIATNSSGQATIIYTSGQISEKVKIRISDPNGALSSVDVEITVSLIGDAKVGIYPNPVKITQKPVNIEYKLDEDGEVKILITDVMGQEVWRKTYAAGSAGGRAGFNVIQWDGKNGIGRTVAVGIYGAHLDITSRGQTTRINSRFGVWK